MQIGQRNGVGQGQRYSAKNTVVPVSFMCAAPEAQSVSVIGDFNGWNPTANQMKRHPDGSWQSSFPVHSGHHRYQFLIDGVPHLDPQAQGVVKLDDEAKASLLSVS
ncbi:MAG: 1,4-alpha-glucan branching enzyme GlgB [Verrucomicrobia subdivision 3 bacterium]|nr:1,4-alpha-glucan branching enzyme GlgB [Limisphaerales bacterium]MCS1413637.1 1,4-alpha-glucan branching enzyme GlgB [Limisphaerales bacterium]